ncbi:MAG: HEAT repeat domain-containing protein [Myxococcota bacterium]|nr:HEAT repeat domain-containing protein [Myxococcota bacterium]
MIPRILSPSVVPCLLAVLLLVGAVREAMPHPVFVQDHLFVLVWIALSSLLACSLRRRDMETRLHLLLSGAALLALACSDSQRVEPHAEIPAPPSVVIETVDLQEPDLPKSAVETDDFLDPAPPKPSTEVEAPDEAVLERVDPSAVRLDDALVRGDDVALEEAMRELEERGGSGAITALGTVLKNHPDKDIRLDALDSISVVNDDGPVPREVVEALGDPDPEVRIEALDFIADSEDMTMLSVLETHFVSERDEDVREVYSDAIDQLGDVYGDAIEELRESRLGD